MKRAFLIMVCAITAQAIMAQKEMGIICDEIGEESISSKQQMCDNAESESSDTITLNTTRTSYGGFRLYYDDAGNIIQKQFYSFQNRAPQGVETEQVNTETLFDNYNISIKTDFTWANVSISILGDIEPGRNSSLSIHNMTGTNCYTIPLDNNYMRINLSSLPKGIYLFHITIDGTTVTKKLIKHQ